MLCYLINLRDYVVVWKTRPLYKRHSAFSEISSSNAVDCLLMHVLANLLYLP